MTYFLRQKKNSPYYYCVLKIKEGDKWHNKEISTGITIKGNNKRKAEKKCEEICQQYEKMYGAGNVNISDIQFTDYLESWLESQKRLLKPSTLYGYSSIMDNHVIPYFKPKKLKLIEVTPKHIQDYYNMLLDKKLAVSSVRRHHANIRKALQDAMEQNMIPCNVADRTKLPKQKQYHHNTYDKKQLKVLLKIAQGTAIESAIMLSANYGLRRGEVAGLTWSDVNFDARELYIRNTRVTAKDEIFQESTKTASSYRTLPIEQNMYDYLTALKQKQEDNKSFYGNTYSDSGFVCCYDNGKPLRVSYISHAFSELLEKNDLPHIRFHDLRHSVATLLLDSEVDLKIIQEILGHSTISTTANIYLHPGIEEKRKAFGKISDIFEHTSV